MKNIAFAIAGVSCLFALDASAQTINPDFGGCYNIRNLGSVPGVPASYGGLTFHYNDPDLMLICGGANGGAGNIYSIRVTRDGEGIINGFVGTAQLYAAATFNDGGLAFGPNNVLFFTRFSTHVVSQIKPGSTTSDKDTSMNPFLPSSTGTLQFVPPGYPGAGRFKVASYTQGQWSDISLTPDDTGTFTLISPPNSAVQLGGGGPEGIVFVQPGNPGFTKHSVLVSEYRTGKVIAYEIDSIGDPILSTRRELITGLGGAEGGTRDPRTGHFMFSTFGGGNKVIVVTGFNLACPANFNADCGVDDADFSIFALAYNILDCEDPAMPENCPADLNHDGIVDDSDFSIFIVAYNSLICN